MKQSSAKAPWLFYALVIYVVAQFLWWEVLLARQTGQLAEEQKKIAGLNYADRSLLEENIAQIEKKRMHQLYMHVGEGMVFLILLSLGVLKIYNTRKREIELTRLQDNFLLSVTHELKSPLASVKLQLQTMQKHKLDEQTQNSLLQKALADNERLLRMIDNILLASKTGNGQSVLQMQQLSINEVVQKLVEQSFAVSGKRIEITSEENIIINADEQVLSIILSNLIENALKYSPADKAIKVNIQSPANLMVIDEGAGIPGPEKEKIFEKFYRIGNEETRSAKGTGLGLYIVKNLCALHHIEVTVTDNKPQGTIFTLKFR
ncbi:MAG TPA: ATP-binding protein [Bacteroidia bacterium]|nr:ATP-binding protein [Bacteroidia bacterium]